MYQSIIVFLSVFSTLNSAYFPFKKNSHFPDDTCRYQYGELVTYVKECENGKYCKYRGGDFSICENIPTEITLLTADSNEKCESNFECETGLECINSKCTFSSDCQIGTTRVRTKSGYKCKDSKKLDKFYTKDFTWHDDDTNLQHKGYITGTTYINKYYEHFKVGGKITSFNETTDTNGKIYEPKDIEYSDIGSVADGDFVFDEKSCQSGFALYFYGNGELNNPYDDNYSYNYMYKRCVTLEDIEDNESGYCTIKYTLNGKTLSYNVKQIDSNAKTLTSTRQYDQNNGYVDITYYGYTSPYLVPNYFDYIDSSAKNNLCTSDLKIKTKIFQKYIGTLTDDIKKCSKNEEKSGYLETCQNNQLRKWSYLYTNPSIYVLYYDEEEEDKGNTVINYLVQTEFPSYQSSPFLNIKYFICLLLLLSF